jgi:hypothetical protein
MTSPYRIILNDDQQTALKNADPELYEKWYDHLWLCRKCADDLFDSMRRAVSELSECYPFRSEYDANEKGYDYGKCQLCEAPILEEEDFLMKLIVETKKAQDHIALCSNDDCTGDGSWKGTAVRLADKLVETETRANRYAEALAKLSSHDDMDALAWAEGRDDDEEDDDKDEDGSENEPDCSSCPIDCDVCPHCGGDRRYTGDEYGIYTCRECNRDNQEPGQSCQERRCKAGLSVPGCEDCPAIHEKTCMGKDCLPQTITISGDSMTKNPENKVGDDYVNEVRKELGFSSLSVLAIHETDKPTIYPSEEVIRVLGDRLALVSHQLCEERKTTERLRNAHEHNEKLIAELRSQLSIARKQAQDALQQVIAHNN